MDTSFACEALLLPLRQFLPFPLLLAKGFHENIVCLFKLFFFFSGKVTSQPSPYIQYRACTTGSQKVW